MDMDIENNYPLLTIMGLEIIYLSCRSHRSPEAYFYSMIARSGG
jgi:hypothetical protein